VLGQPTEAFYGQSEVVSVGHGLAVIALAEEEGRRIRTGDDPAKVTETLKLFQGRWGACNHVPLPDNIEMLMLLEARPSWNTKVRIGTER
jgi:hypothetical protein